MNHAVIVALGRSAIGKAPKGALRGTRPDTAGAQVLKGVLKQVPQLDPALIEDVILGCAFPEAEQGYNLAKIVAAGAGLPDSVPGQTVNRFCSSGLQTIALAANSIMAGQAEVVAAGGVEFMSTIPMGGNTKSPNPVLIRADPRQYTSMGITAENVADRYGITRQMQDEFAVRSHQRAAAARAAGKFAQEIIPISATAVTYGPNGFPVVSERPFVEDEGIRPNVSLESLAKLKTVFRQNGSVTAGNASQTSDGIGMALLMSEQKAKELGIRPLARFLSFGVVGVPADYMGIGPMYAIPKALKLAGKEISDIDLFEINEAFASQALACVRELGIDPQRVNVNGGAIAMGHPLGATGAILTTKLIHELRRQEKATGVVSMCIGGGMGAAAVFQLL